MRHGKTIYAEVCICRACGTGGLGMTGWTDLCPYCQASPRRRGWYEEMNAITALARREARAHGLPDGAWLITDEVKRRYRALGRVPK